MLVKIYVLVDPITLKVRYIGRTRSELKKRLYEHIKKSGLPDQNTHKANWIKSLLKKGLSPKIRLLTTIEGWSESHVLERSLIHKYKDRLLNHEDRGEGGLNHIVSEEQKVAISNTLKYKYRNKIVKHPREKIVYVYNFDGSFYKEYNSINEAAIDLNLKSRGKIYNSIKNKTKNKHYKNYQFSFEKVDKMENLNNLKLSYDNWTKVTMKNKNGKIFKFNSVKECADFLEIEKCITIRTLLGKCNFKYGDEYEFLINNEFKRSKYYDNVVKITTLNNVYYFDSKKDLLRHFDYNVSGMDENSISKIINNHYEDVTNIEFNLSTNCRSCE